MEGRPLEDSALIDRAKGGDVGAYEEIVRRYRAPALRAATIVVGSSDAEDVAQEAFVKAYRALPRFRAGAAFRPWLLRIVTNEARNRRKASGRRVALALRAAEAEQTGPSTEAVVVARTERETLLAAVNRLADADRQIIGYRYFLELSEAETAEALGIARGTAKSRLARALDRLRGHLAEEADHGMQEADR